MIIDHFSAVVNQSCATHCGPLQIGPNCADRSSAHQSREGHQGEFASRKAVDYSVINPGSADHLHPGPVEPLPR